MCCFGNIFNEYLKMTTRKTIKADIRRELLSREKCANYPFVPATGCIGYKCPLWLSNNGFFDESGKEIDHIVEVTHGGTNDISNLQVLCPCCHAVKTKRCAKQKWDFTSEEIDSGKAHMETEKPKKRKRSSSL
jgi:5-methylcytosine-specific restriction endonuclease McrA